MDNVKRNRTDLPAIIAYGLYLYFSSRSYRFASKSLEQITKRSHVSIWKWMQKCSYWANKFKVNRHSVREIFVDETLIKINGKYYWLWLAYEPNLHVCLFAIPHIKRKNYVCLYVISFSSRLEQDLEESQYIF